MFYNERNMLILQGWQRDKYFSEIVLYFFGNRDYYALHDENRNQDPKRNAVLTTRLGSRSGNRSN
jgi:hypothetical protein